MTKSRERGARGWLESELGVGGSGAAAEWHSNGLGAFQRRGTVIEIVKLLVPGSWALLLIGLTALALAAVAYPSLRRLAACAGIALIGLYLVLAMPWTARALAQSLSIYPPLRDAAQARGARALTVLGGDHEAARVKEAVRVYWLLNPDWVIVSGDEELREAITAAGIPPDRVLWEHEAANTRQQALAIRRVAAAAGIGRMVLVASPIHLPRSVRAAAAAGLDVIPSAPGPPHPNLPETGVGGITPNAEALRFSSESVYEYLAVAYYWSRGWLSPPGFVDISHLHG